MLGKVVTSSPVKDFTMAAASFTAAISSNVFPGNRYVDACTEPVPNSIHDGPPVPRPGLVVSSGPSLQSNDVWVPEWTSGTGYGASVLVDMRLRSAKQRSARTFSPT